MILGLVGPFAAGKSTASDHLASRGFFRIDVDRLGHEALASRASDIVEAFGPEVLGPDGQVDRRALGARVFADPAELRKLQAIVHPQMSARAVRLARSAPDSVIDAALLFRMNLDKACDHVIWLHSPLLLRLMRAIRRDRRGIRAALQRLRSQQDLRLHLRQSTADIRKVYNGISRRALARRLDRVLVRLRAGEGK